MTGIKVTLPRPEGRVEVDITEVRPEEWPHLVVLETRYGRSGWDVARRLAEWVNANVRVPVVEFRPAIPGNTGGPPPSDG